MKVFSKVARETYVTLVLILGMCVVATCIDRDCEQFTIEKTDSSLEIRLRNRSILLHTDENPALEVGLATSSFQTHVGNFYIDQQVKTRIALKHAELLLVDEEPVTSSTGSVSRKHNSLKILFFEAVGDAKPQAKVSFKCGHAGNSHVEVEVFPVPKFSAYNRLWLKIPSTPTEKVYGGGEQFTHFNLRGHAFPMWAREQGVGRDYKKLVTWLAEWIGGAGGDFHTTYWPQATFVSPFFYVHVNHSWYNVLNFTNGEFHELELWEDVRKVNIYIDVANSWPSLMTKLTGFFGRQPPPPKWIYNGAIIGLQGGKDEVFKKFGNLKEQGVQISAVWIQDWPGKFITSLGKRVYWNWQISEKFYWPRKETISQLKSFKEQGIRFLSYINPHVIEGSEMYKFADEKGFFIKNATTGKTLLVDFDEFECGSVDFTNPEAYQWYKTVLKSMLELGFSGWMADFGGEYLPVADEIQFYDKRESSGSMHNYYSFLWAKLNREVVEETKTLDDTFIFMRSGYASSPGQTLMAWAGDQNVDYFHGDGMPSVIPASLSLGMSGMGLTHSDIGGYVSLNAMVRNEELILRWAEMSIFSQVMRTHEGNRPDRNWQVYTTNNTMKNFARLSRLHTILRPYHEFVARQNHLHGWPTQRPLFFAYPDDEQSYDIQYQYMYGPDILVAPVLTEGAQKWSLYLPPDEWVYLWDDSQYVSHERKSRSVVVNAPIGRPPVFYRKYSKWESVFQQMRKQNYHRFEELQGLSWSLLWCSPMIFFYLLLRKFLYYVLFYF